MKKISFESRLVLIYIGWMFVVFPLYSRGNYFNLTESKWQMLAASTTIFILLWACSRVTDGKWLKSDIYNTNFNVFGICVILSGILSPYGSTAWTGLGARYTGGIFVLMMLVMMIFIGNTPVSDVMEKMLWLYIAGGIVLSLWAGLNFVGIDVFHMHDGMYEGQIRSYVSGLGNIVFFASYFCMYLPVSFVMYMRVPDKKQQYIYMAGILFGSFAAFISGTDSAVICIFALILGIVPLLIRDKEMVKKFLQALFLVMAMGIFAAFLWNVSSYGDSAFDTVMKLLIEFHAFEAGLLLCVVAGVILYLLKDKYNVRIIKLCYYAVVLLLFGIFFASMDQFGELFTFDESWGNGRGYAWINAVKIFKEEPFINKVFGNGADTFANLLVDYTGSNVGTNGQYFDNVHCEYLQYLLSFGIAGTAVYIYMLAYIIRMLVKYQDKPFCAAAAMGLLGYMLQAVMGLNQVFTTPVFFIFVGMSVALLRDVSVNAVNKKNPARR